MKERVRMSLSVGGPTIIMIFVILCLTTLGTLSLVTANTDLKLTEKTAAYTVAYYSADSLGEEFLAKVDGIIKAGRLDFQQLDDTLARQLPDGSHSIIYNTPIGEEQYLRIELLIPADFGVNDDPNFHIVSWKTETAQVWDYEEYQIQID
jgi:hypothetical protein